MKKNHLKIIFLFIGLLGIVLFFVSSASAANNCNVDSRPGRIGGYDCYMDSDCDTVQSGCTSKGWNWINPWEGECTYGKCCGDDTQENYIVKGASGICCDNESKDKYCDSDSDCNDSKECTVDACVNPGTCNSYCANNLKPSGTPCLQPSSNACNSSGNCVNQVENNAACTVFCAGKGYAADVGCKPLTYYQNYFYCGTDALDPAEGKAYRSKFYGLLTCSGSSDWCYCEYQESCLSSTMCTSYRFCNEPSPPPFPPEAPRCTGGNCEAQCVDYKIDPVCDRLAGCGKTWTDSHFNFEDEVQSHVTTAGHYCKEGKLRYGSFYPYYTTDAFTDGGCSNLVDPPCSFGCFGSYPSAYCNQLPGTPTISGPAIGIAGTSYSYTANATDPDGNQIKYYFDWGDATSYTTDSLVNSGTSQTASHAWGSAGTYNVYVYSIDSHGYRSASAATQTVKICASGNCIYNGNCYTSGVCHPVISEQKKCSAGTWQNVSGVSETCNGIDDDCDGSVDEGVKNTYYRDNDNDNYGNASVSTLACSAPPGYVANSSDCNDANAAIHPGATEIVGDGIDQNCNGQEICYIDADNDGYRLTSTLISADTDCSDSGEAVSSDPVGDCNDANAAIHPGATEACDGIDNDCDGTTDEGCSCVNGATQSCGPATDVGACQYGTQSCAGGAWGACVGAVYPAPETCNGIDDDCDGSVDEGVKNTYYRDSDGDTYGKASVSTLACSAPSGYVANSSDCNDANAAINPGATEIAGDGVDQNCNGQEICYVDADNDGYRLTSTLTSADTDCLDSGEAVSSDTTGDCNDVNAAIHPGATEACDGIDNDCDGTTDEGCSCVNGDTQSCGTDVGACEYGTQICVSGSWGSCTGGVNPVAETCSNGIDDDCDGLTDGADTANCAPDLIIFELYSTPASPQDGTFAHISVTVKNQGSILAGSSWLYYYGKELPSGSWTYLDSDRIDSLNPGGSQGKDTDVLCQGDGFQLQAVADSQDEVSESNETNNEATITVNCSSAPNPCIPVSGDWTIPAGTTCVVQDKIYTISGNVVVYGTLDLKGATNIKFSGSPRYIYVYTQGKIYQSNTAGFNK